MSFMTVEERLDKLRERMKNESVDVCLMTSTDFHASEYVSDYFKVTEFFSGCTSDNVILIVSRNSAALWTDGRYFISAAKELEGSSITLMRTGEPGVLKVEEYLSKILSESAKSTEEEAGASDGAASDGQAADGEASGSEASNRTYLAYDARCIRADRGSQYRQIAAACNAAVKDDFDAADGIWENRPEFPANPLWIMDESVAGQSVKSKLEKTKERMKQKGATGLILTKPDEIMWLTNLRGNDILFNPVALSYMILNGSETVFYIKEKLMTKEIVSHLSSCGIELRSYDEFFKDLAAVKWEGRVMTDPFSVSDAVIGTLAEAGIRPLLSVSPVMALKAVKNETELANLRAVYLQDSAAVCRYLYRLDKYIKEGKFSPEGQLSYKETDAAGELDDMRRTIDGYLSPSFETISAFGENAAIVHYEPKKETEAAIREGSFLLLDSGGQYKNGTTDITRTVPIGEVSAKMKEHFTYVAVANLRLLTAQFRRGCTGANLDSIAREVLWENGLDYNHGTGHGIGYCLNVHEGPQNISWKITRESIGANTPFEPGMITSDEPGFYLEGEYGIRTESVVECVADETDETGRFLRLRPLTFVPISLDALDVSLLDASDIERLNAYHEEVYKRISPLLTDSEEKEWLRRMTAPVL
ncbi:MAG: aminopeptidase P family protein [Lachnospiraceae bacterium]|nr:aminopeptidase P family protein [Lachnospiraceae bacterium]